MKKLAATGFAVLLALAMSAATFDTSDARHRDRNGFSFGLSFGTPSYYGHYPRYRPYPVYRYAYPVAPRRVYRGGWNAHVAWCYDRYRSYRAYDNTFQPYNGPRRECRSPFLG